MAYPLPCLWSPFNWPTNRLYSYEHVSSICGVSADLIRDVDRGDYISNDHTYLSERIERVNFALASLANGYGPTATRIRLENREWRERQAQDRELAKLFAHGLAR